MTFEDDSHASSLFVNRRWELEWLARVAKARASWNKTIGISGPAGIGKTALALQFLRLNSLRPAFVSPERVGGEVDFDRLDYMLRNSRARKTNAVIIDNLDLGPNEIADAIKKVFNWKAIRLLVIAQRRSAIGEYVDLLHLEPFDETSTLELYRRIAGDGVLGVPRSVLALAQGHPLAIHLIANLLQTHDPSTLEALLQGSLYSLENNILVPRRELITSIKSTIVVANEKLIQHLKSRPQDIHQIGHRKFEELIAELLSDMNFDVELTPATRDGGRDVLAYWNSPLGRLLCLVEAKKHRPDRPVGIQLVRNLYGTLMDEQATSSMLVTTSDFSSEARKFEKRHEWQLSLKNYTNLVEWINSYKRPKTFQQVASSPD